MTLLVLYDADCGFCTSSVAALAGPVFQARFQPTAWQSADLAEHGLTAKECQARLHVVDGSSTCAGAAAIARILRTARLPWRIAGRIMTVPGLSWLSERVYDLVAQNRHRLPGGTAACNLAAGPPR